MSSGGWTTSDKSTGNYGFAGSSKLDLDSKKAADEFLAAAQFVKPGKVEPVPGVPPHLWAANQDKKIGIVQAKKQSMYAQPVMQAPDQEVSPRQWTRTRNEPKPDDEKWRQLWKRKAPEPATQEEQLTGWLDDDQVEKLQHSKQPPTRSSWAQVASTQPPPLSQSFVPAGMANVYPQLLNKSTVRQEQAALTSAGAPVKALEPQMRSLNINSAPVRANPMRYELPLETYGTPMKTAHKPADAGWGPVQVDRPPRVSTRTSNVYPGDGRGTPRPNKNYSYSTPSLPSVSEFNVSGSFGRESSAAFTQNGSDIRMEIAPKHNLHDYGEYWLKYNWSDPYGRDNDEAFQTRSFLERFVEAWREAVPSFKTHFLELPWHWRSDIDTNTGIILAPVEYPETYLDFEKVNPSLEWRRQNWTAEYLIKRDADKDPELRSFHHGRRHHKSSRHKRDKGVGRNVEVVKTNPYAPTIPCYLRPAQQADIEEMTTIYNHEVQNGLQASDSFPISSLDMFQAFKEAKQQEMPFLAAVGGMYQPKGENMGMILGFAYLSLWEPGLSNSDPGSGKKTARVKVFVHPEWKRKKVGFSLLDKLFSTVSSCYTPKAACEFFNPERDPVYGSHMDHNRQFYHLYLHYHVRHQHRANREQPELLEEEEQKAYDSDLVWVRKLLTETFNCQEKVRLEAVHQSADKTWLDSVVFEHACFVDPRAADN